MRPPCPAIAACLLFTALFPACTNIDKPGGADQAAESMTANDDGTPGEMAANESVSADRRLAGSTAAALDDRCLAAQVIISGIDGRGALTRDMKILLGECPAGGIILFRYNLDTGNGDIRDLIAESAALIASETAAGIAPESLPETFTGGIRPFVAADHEGGSVNRFNRGVASLPAALSYRELALKEGTAAALAGIQADSFRAGTDIKTLGFNLNLAPVAEFLTAYNRDFLDDRSYGPDPLFAAEAAAAFIDGMERAGILCVVKHFPGSAGPDPHRFLSVLPGDKASLDALAAPFAFLVRTGRARAIMAAHTVTPALDSGIASLSAPVMEGWLRRELGFSGIIVSDDFSMSAAAESGSRLSPEAAAVRSLAAGADMVLVWPPDLRRTHRAILAALDGGDLSRERLREAAGRIILEKIRMGLIDGE
jgi:beta-N-acetylhexosaminidase